MKYFCLRYVTTLIVRSLTPRIRTYQILIPSNKEMDSSILLEDAHNPKHIFIAYFLWGLLVPLLMLALSYCEILMLMDNRTIY